MLGVTVNSELIKEIDEFRGEVPRSRVVERALNQYLERVRLTESKNLEGLKGSTPAAQPAPTPTTPTTTSYGSSVMNTATTTKDQQEVIVLHEE